MKWMFNSRNLLMMSGLVAFIAAPASADKMKATLAQSISPLAAIATVAKAKDFYGKHGLDIEVKYFTSGKRSLAAVMGGGADIATNAESPTTAAAMAKQPIAFLARINYAFVKTLVSEKSGIKSIADLAGKKIGYTVGTGGQVYTNYLLKKAGITEKDVTLVNMRPQELLPAMAAGSVDAINSWEPNITNAKRAVKGSSIIDTKGIYAESFNVLTLRPFLNKNPELFVKLMRAYIDAEKFLKKNPEESIKIVAKRAGMQPSDLKAIWNDYTFSVVLDDKTVKVLKAHAAWRLETGNHPEGAKMPDFMKVIEPGPLRKVDPSRIQITGM
tara:strand:+ start:1036 stop:2019 length:984 start_codon:yes stop_codon:yes gene_type:complete